MAGLADMNLKATDGTTQQFALGDEADVGGGARWKYVKASGAVAANALCHITAANLIIEATTTLVGTAARPTGLAVPQFAFATGEYGWVPIGPFNLREDGVTTFKVLAANAATSVRLYTTATAGVVDDAVTTGLVSGLALTETVTTQEAADCVAVSRLVSFCEL
jgi:hypothetical protein